MENDLMIERIDYRKIYEDFFYLLQTSNDLDDFCQCTYQILSEYLILNNFLIINQSTDQLTINNISYSYDIKINIQEYLLVIDTIINCQSQCINNHIYFNYQKNNCDKLNYHLTFKEQNIKYLYILPIKFKQVLFGYLVVDIEKFNLPENEAENIIKILLKHLAIYLYQLPLEITYEKLKEEEKKILQSKENQTKYLSHMNHELRTPVAAVIGFAKMLQQQLYGTLNSKQLQYVDAIHQSGKYLLDLISDLLDISKIEAQKEDLFLENVLVKELCESSLALIKNRAQEQNLELKLNILPDIKYCYVDQRRIKQILVNLLSNAVKFTINGSITLDVKEENNYLQFNIIDTGIGINKKSQEKLFQPFSQLNTPLHRHHRGTGLGLVISRELAKLHGGDILLISEENKGSCFTLSIPIKSSKF